MHLVLEPPLIAMLLKTTPPLPIALLPEPPPIALLPEPPLVALLLLVQPWRLRVLLLLLGLDLPPQVAPDRRRQMGLLGPHPPPHLR